MNFLKKINRKASIDDDTGFGSNASNYGGRFLNKNGSPNVKKEGLNFIEGVSWFHSMLTISRWNFLLILVLFYFVVNLLFASLYFAIGVENLNGITAENSLEEFGQAFFFSIQTFTTVGYGHINPTGFWTSFVSSIEAFTGLLTFAIATGLFYGRFSKPKAYIKFSHNALIAPYKDFTALMFRMTPYKNTNLSDVETRVSVGIVLEEKGEMVNKFFTLDLELEKVNTLNLSWTVVHPITENSPFYGFTEQDYRDIDGEILVFTKVFDDMYSSHVIKRTSYTFDEIVYGAKFDLMYNRSKDDTKTILHVDKLNSYQKVHIN